MTLPRQENDTLSQQTDNDTLQSDLEALNAAIEAEEREDRRAEALRRRQGLPEPPRNIRVYAGFSSGESTPRT